MYDIFLCVKYKNKNYKCKGFDDFIKAEEYYRYNTNKFNLASSTMIPVFSYIPSFMKRSYLQYQLSNMFGRVEIKNSEDNNGISKLK